MISQELVSILNCPICQSRIRIDETNSFVICMQCTYEFIVKENIPILIQQQEIAVPEEVESHGK